MSFSPHILAALFDSPDSGEETPVFNTDGLNANHIAGWAPEQHSAQDSVVENFVGKETHYSTHDL
jgi:hypothetical protein